MALVPVTVLLVVAARPIVQVLFGRGDFDAAALATTARVAAWYAGSALGLAMRSVASHACLAVCDRRHATTVALVAMGVNVVGDLTLGVTYGVAGIALSTTASLAVAALLAVVLLARQHDGVTLPPLTATGLRLGAAATAAALAGVLVPVVAGTGRRHTVQGNAGNDELVDEFMADNMSGNEVMRGGTGNDRIYIGFGRDKPTETQETTPSSTPNARRPTSTAGRVRTPIAAIELAVVRRIEGYESIVA